MKLYSGTTDPFSQSCRIVLYEKEIDFQIIDVDMFNKTEEIEDINPFGMVPVLVERDLVLFESSIINEYIDERFPIPQLMPPDAEMRARTRLALHRCDRELFRHIPALEQGESKTVAKARQSVSDYLTQISALFLKQKYMMGDEYSMLDVAIAPLLWRLDHYGIQLGKDAAPLLKYAERLFSRPSYLQAMTPAEKAMRKTS